MKKQSGPSLRIEIPPMKRCTDCNGAGELKGLLHQMECHTCNATGVLHKETGDQIPTSIVLIAMRRLIRSQRQQIAQLKQSLPADDHDPYKGMGKRHGGNHRMD